MPVLVFIHILIEFALLTIRNIGRSISSFLALIRNIILTFALVYNKFFLSCYCNFITFLYFFQLLCSIELSLNLIYLSYKHLLKALRFCKIFFSDLISFSQNNWHMLADLLLSHNLFFITTRTFFFCWIWNQHKYFFNMLYFEQLEAKLPKYEILFLFYKGWFLKFSNWKL